MIPKIIHYTWFSNDPFPEEVRDCMGSWKRLLPDYEFRHWDMDAISQIESEFLKEALSAKKWAYAADFVRLFAVYHYGGVYLDTDVMLYRSLDPLLDTEAFIGKEVSIHIESSKQEMYLSSHCFGAEKGNDYIGSCLKYYDNRKFIQSTYEYLPQTLRYNLVILPFIQSEIAKQIGYDPRPLSQGIQRLRSLTVYPSVCFDSDRPGEDAYCRHLALGSWRDPSYRQGQKITLGYKINWRIRAAFNFIAGLVNYKLIKLSGNPKL